MRILHTSDWHLGHKLCDRDQHENHTVFLNWLYDTIVAEKVELLLIAGDIFDTGNPPNYALKQYYDFLKRVMQSPCRHVVVTGGNHDSAATLNAPKELLSHFNIHVVGCTTGNLADEVIRITDEQGQCQVVVCAVPYLRDRDIRFSIAGESYEERQARIKEGISNHYNEVAALAAPDKESGIPVIAMGHLYAAGGDPSEAEKEIHIGNLGQIGAESFSPIYDYVALGHLHRPQMIGGKEYIRYCGSPIPLSFSEINDTKQVVILDAEPGKEIQMDIRFIPTWRRLVRFKGPLNEVCLKLAAFEVKPGEATPWAEVRLVLNAYEPGANAAVIEAIEGKNIDILKVIPEYTKQSKALDEQLEDEQELDMLDARFVFEKKLESKGIAENEELKLAFSELLSSMSEREEMKKEAQV
jgi:DNA repair protein SbcD/Mre11